MVILRQDPEWCKIFVDNRRLQ